MVKIWIIDDDKIFRYTSERYLKHIDSDLRVCQFDSSQRALLKLKESSAEEWPEVILLDLNLPVYDGWDFLEDLNKDLPALAELLKIFVVSSSVDQRDKDRALQYSFVKNYLVKPMDEEVFRKMIEITTN